MSTHIKFWFNENWVSTCFCFSLIILIISNKIPSVQRHKNPAYRSRTKTDGFRSYNSDNDKQTLVETLIITISSEPLQRSRGRQTLAFAQSTLENTKNIKILLWAHTDVLNFAPNKYKPHLARYGTTTHVVSRRLYG